MTNFEMVELLRQKADISYEEAKTALELANWDLLDAMLVLEREGKIKSGPAHYSTREEAGTEEAESRREKKRRDCDGVRIALRWLGQTLTKLIRIGNENSLVVCRKGQELFSLPVMVCVVLLMCSVGTVLLFALAVGLFCGLRYSFRGPNLGKESINSAMNRAADAAETVKEEIRSAGSEKKSQQEKGEDESK